MEGVASGYAFARAQEILLKVRDARVLHCKAVRRGGGGTGWQGSERRRQSKYRREAVSLAGPKRLACGSTFAKRSLQPFGHRRSNGLMEAGDVAKAARPRPTWAKPMKRELIAKGVSPDAAERGQKTNKRGRS